jgi:hypothetical protein
MVSDASAADARTLARMLHEFNLEQKTSALYYELEL